MKTYRMHHAVLGLAVSLSPAILLAQDPSTMPGSSPQSRQSLPSAAAANSSMNQQESSPSPGTTAQEMQDKMFLRKASEGGMAEVKLGQLAADKGSSEEVKSFGSKMVTDHTMLNNEMKPIADAKGVRVPKQLSKMDQAEYDKLSSLSGDDFDKEYITAMVKDHRKDLREFHAEATTTQDPALKASVTKAEGVIRDHTQMITKLAKSKGIMVQPGSAPAATAPPAS